MDMYCYFLERFREGGNPYASFERCEVATAELADNPNIPARVTLAVATDLLCAVADFAGNGCAVSPAFRRVRQLVDDVCQRMAGICQTEDQVWRREQAELGEPGDDYACWPVDFDNGEDEDEDDDGCEGEWEADRQPFPDWATVENWTSGDWLQFQIWKEKILAVALLHNIDHAHVITDAIARIEDNISRFPMARRAEAGVWCRTLADELYVGVEAGLDQVTTNICKSGQ